MNIEVNKTVKIEELKDIIPRKAGGTWSALWQVFYLTRLFKYIHKKHFIEIKKSFNKICTYEKLYKMCKMGYLKSPQKDIYCATDKVLEILKEAGLAVELLPDEARGKGDINELNNTTVFIQLAKREHFHTLLYPHFGYICPDALLVEMDQEMNKYKLTFIEVEKKKTNWTEYIQDKRDKYIKLSKDEIVFNYWKETCKNLKIEEPDSNDFCFTVSFFGSIKKDFGEGFSFGDI